MRNQKFQYGLIINVALTVNDVFQIWNTQPYGNVLYRCGNGSGDNGGWYINWTPFSPGTATAAQVLKGYTFSSAAGSNLTGTYDPGNDYNNGYNAGYSAGNSNGYTNGYNAGRENIRVVSGQYYANSDESVYYSNAWRSRKVVAFNPGGNPMIAFAYRTDHADSVVMTSTGLKLIIGTSFQAFTSDHDFNSSSVHLPTATNTSATWNWYCAIY